MAAKWRRVTLEILGRSYLLASMKALAIADLANKSFFLDFICVLTPFARISYLVLLNRRGNNDFHSDLDFY